MRNGKLVKLAFLVLILFSFVLSADDLFDLDSNGGASSPADSSDAVASDSAKDSVVAEKKATPKIAKTASVDMKKAVADKEAEKKLRQLTIKEKDKIKVVQEKEFTKDGRFELGFDLGYISGDWDNVMTVGARASFHFNEYLALRGRFLYGVVPMAKDTRNQVEDTKDGLNSSVSSSTMTLTGGASVVFSPIYGKVSVFGNMIPKYDLNISLGAFFYQTNLEYNKKSETSKNIAIKPGVEAKVFLNKNFTLNLGFDWFMMKDNRFSHAGGKTSYLKTDFMFSASVSMFLPFE